MTSPSASWPGAPRDWAPGDVFLESRMDDISSALMFLKNRPYDVVTVATTTTTSVTFVQMTGASITFTNTSGGRVAIWFNGSITNSGGANIYMDIAIDGTRQGDPTNGLVYYGISIANLRQQVHIWFLTDTAPTAGSHVYTIHWKTSSGTATWDTVNAQFGVIDLA